MVWNVNFRSWILKYKHLHNCMTWFSVLSMSLFQKIWYFFHYHCIFEDHFLVFMLIHLLCVDLLCYCQHFHLQFKTIYSFSFSYILFKATNLLGREVWSSHVMVLTLNWFCFWKKSKFWWNLASSALTLNIL